MTKHHRSSSKVNPLSVICPVCGRWKEKTCVHTGGSRKGDKRSAPHSERVALAAKTAKNGKAITAKIEKDFSTPVPKRSDPKEKLNAEQKNVVKVVLEKIEALGKHATFKGPVSKGPIITTYRFFPERHTKVAQLETMWKDFAVALGAEAIVVKRMPGESSVGVFVPNIDREIIQFRDLLPNVLSYMEQPTRDKHLKIPLNFGIDSNGEPYLDDLTMQPHMLMAGTTGSGKSTEAHNLMLSMCWAMSPKQLQVIISDTKAVEFRMFGSLPHLMFPIATSVYKTMEALQECIQLSQRRLDLIGTKNVRNIHEYNRIVPEADRFPFVVIFIDELADIMGPSQDRYEAQLNSQKLSTIVQRSRAAGIYVIASTQRPDVKLVAGSIKANFPTRLAFRLPSQIDSRTVLNTKGAEGLLSQGDMFYISSMSNDMKRLHAPLTSVEDVKTTVEAILQRYQTNEKEAGRQRVLAAAQLPLR